MVLLLSNLAIPITIAVAAGGVIYRSLKGRRVDNHPLCRRCGFDLIGTLPSSNICPECGRDVSSARSRLEGHRVRRHGLAIMSSLVFMFSAIWLAAIVEIRGGKVRVIELEPTAWLIHQVKSVDPKTRDVAFAELMSRFNRSKLSNAQIKEFAEIALNAQGDVNKQWWPDWGDWLERSQRLRKLSPEQWNRYLRQSIVLELQARNPIYGDDPLPVKLRQTGRRIGRSGAIFQIVGSWGELHAGKATVNDFCGSGARPPPMMTFPTVARANGWINRTTDSAVSVPGESLPDGRQRISAVFHAIIRERAGSGSLDLLHEVDVNISTDVVHKAGKANIQLEPDTAKAALVEGSLGMPPVRVWGWDDRVALAFRIDRPPVDLAFDIIVRADGIEWSIGSLTVKHGGWFSARTQRELTGFYAKKLDVILRPSPDAALYTIDMERIWGQEIILRGITVKQSAFLGEDEPDIRLRSPSR